MSQPSHSVGPTPAARPARPLGATYRTGVVDADMSGMPATCNVNIGGDNQGNDYDSGILWPCAYLDTYRPEAGDTVALLGQPGSYVILGRIADGSGYDLFERSWFYQVMPFGDFGSTTRTFLCDMGTVPFQIPDWSKIGNYVIDVTLTLHAAIITAGAIFNMDFSTISTGFATAANQTIPQIGGDASSFSLLGSWELTGWWDIPSTATTLNVRLNAQRMNGTGAIRAAGGYSRWSYHIHRKAGT